MDDLLYKVTSADGRACHGGSGRWSLPDGDTPGAWMPRVAVNPCSSGYHLCRPGDLINWLGERIWIAEGRGDPVACGDKIVYPEARIVAPTRWDEQRARLFAADCAAMVLHLFERERPGDDRPRLAITTARDYAMGRVADAARDAAWDAARAAARDAARAAARDAARDAAWAAAWAAAKDAALYAALDAALDAAWAAALYAALAAAKDAALYAALDAAWDAAKDAALDVRSAILLRYVHDVAMPEPVPLPEAPHG